MQAPPAVRLLPVPQPDEGDGGSRQGETIAAGALVLKPRTERRPFASPLYRKAYLMKSTVNPELALQDTTSCVYRVNDIHLSSWARNLEQSDDGHVYCPFATRN